MTIAVTTGGWRLNCHIQSPERLHMSYHMCWPAALMMEVAVFVTESANDDKVVSEVGHDVSRSQVVKETGYI